MSNAQKLNLKLQVLRLLSIAKSRILTDRELDIVDQARDLGVVSYQPA